MGESLPSEGKDGGFLGICVCIRIAVCLVGVAQFNASIAGERLRHTRYSVDVSPLSPHTALLLETQKLSQVTELKSTHSSQKSQKIPSWRFYRFYLFNPIKNRQINLISPISLRETEARGIICIKDRAAYKSQGAKQVTQPQGQGLAISLGGILNCYGWMAII